MPRKIKVGEKYVKLKVLEYVGVKVINGKNNRIYLCECECECECGKNKPFEVVGSRIGKRVKSCGCLVKESKEKIIENGSVFGRLTVIGLTGNTKRHSYTYYCKCDCDGKIIIVDGALLKRRATRSCGCFRRELLKKNARKAYRKNFIEGTNIANISNKKLSKNNTSGTKGVCWQKRSQKWKAYITFQKKNYCLGHYEDIEEAAKVRKEAEERLHDRFLEWYKSQKK